MSSSAPDIVSLAIGAEPVTYVVRSDMPAAALASDTAALMPPTSSIAESPSANENVMMNTPESEPVLP